MGMPKKYYTSKKDVEFIGFLSEFLARNGSGRCFSGEVSGERAADIKKVAEHFRLDLNGWQCAYDTASGVVTVWRMGWE